MDAVHSGSGSASGCGKIVDLPDARRVAKPWLPADDQDVTRGLVEADSWGLPACVRHGAMNRVDLLRRIYRCQEQGCGVGAEVIGRTACGHALPNTFEEDCPGCLSQVRAKAVPYIVHCDMDKPRRCPVCVYASLGSPASGGREDWKYQVWRIYTCPWCLQRVAMRPWLRFHPEDYWSHWGKPPFYWHELRTWVFWDLKIYKVHIVTRRLRKRIRS